MKKLLCALLTGTMVLSLVACGKGGNTTETEEVTTTEAERIEGKKDTTEEVTTEAEPEEVLVAEGYRVDNGFYYFSARSGEDDKWYIYDMEKREITDSFENGDFVGYWYETSVIRYNEGVYELYDAAGKKTLYTFSDTQTERTSLDINEGGQIVIYDRLQQFEGDVYSFGIIDYQGNWVLPLASDYPWLQEEPTYVTSEYLGDNTYLVTNKYKEECYFVNTDTKSYVPVTLPEGMAIPEFIYCRDGKAFAHAYSYIGSFNNCIFQYDITTGSMIEVLNVSDSYEVRAGKAGEESSYIFSNDDTWCYLKRETEQNSVLDIIASDGTVTEISAAIYGEDFDVDFTDGIHVVARMYNDSSSDYFAVLNADGSYELEPLLVTDSGFSLCAISKGVAVAFNSNGEGFSYNIATKEQTTASGYSVEKFDKDYGMMIVYGEHPEYGSGYYLVDVTDINTLINPFEK